jgi:ComF family protein
LVEKWALLKNAGFVNEFFKFLFAMFFLASRCALCDRPCGGLMPSRLCKTCQRQIQDTQRSQPLETASPAQPFPVFTWGDYEGNLRRSIRHLKYERAKAIGTWLGQQMAESWIKHNPSQPPIRLIVVPIPMFAAKEKLRGYNQAAVIAQQFARSTGYRYAPNLLRRDRETQAQYGVNARSRDANLESAFALGDHARFPSNHQILIVDDIYTTGATVRSALTTLTQHQLTVWGVAVAARPIFHRNFTEIPQTLNSDQS